MFNDLREDYRRYRQANADFPPWRARLNAIGEYGFLAVCVYRYGRWTRRIHPRWISYPFKFLYILLRTLMDILFGINISANSEVGKGFYIGHYGCIFVHAEKIGSNFSVGQRVTIGAKGTGKSNGYPVLGDNVYIGAGAKVIGCVRIGNNVVIGVT